MTPGLERRIRRLSHTELVQVAELVSGLLAPTESAVSGHDMTPAEYKAGMWDRHRPAFTLFQDTLHCVEAVIAHPRDIEPTFARALDMLFIQGYKSFSSIYLLCVRGHGEDAATILRRLLELSAQAIYLARDPSESVREERGGRYVAYHWAQVRDILDSDLDREVKQYWQDMFELHKGLISFDKNGNPTDWWGTRRMIDLFKLIDFEHIYRGDYAFLSKMAHGTSQGILVDYRRARADIRSDHFVRIALVSSCSYILGMARVWNDHFGLLDEAVIEQSIEKCRSFDTTAEREDK